MLFRISRLWALLCLVLVIQYVSARHVQLYDRQDEGDSTITAKGSEASAKDEPTSTASEGSAAESKAKATTTSKTEAPKSTGKDDDEKDDKDATTTFTSDDSEPTSVIVTTDGPLDNSTFYNVTIPEGHLPLEPQLTPGWGVAGTIMLLTGAVYTLVGIKNRMVHTFFSTAYCAALGITVLIVYVMTVPVGIALQGGYVAAIVLSGCALGTGASIFFKELTEGLGCALGGFCISMWLLCLVPGGLLKPVSAKAIFISCFTVAGFAFYFSRYTRDWALIGMISFAGSTIVVLGIDCFSRAGLKEFWAYVWDLNKNLFPLGANTYPVTKGIRVETAAIIIIFLFGIISQIKLWRIVREKREKRALERAEGQRNLEAEEANIGRQVEESNARERREWERAHGNGEADGSEGSLVSGDVNEKKMRDSHGQQSESEIIEMQDMPGSDRGPEPLTETDADGKVIVRVAADEKPEGASDSEDEVDEDQIDDAHSGSRDRMATTEKTSLPQAEVTEPPKVVPLPFSVPQEADARPHSQRSSVATFADDEGKSAGPTRQRSIAKRLSHGSSKLLRNLSPRSSHVRNRSSMDHGESSEELVIPKTEREDDESSIAATFDGQSVEDSARQSVLASEAGQNIEIDARLSGSDAVGGQGVAARQSLVEKESVAAKESARNSAGTAPAGVSQTALAKLEGREAPTSTESVAPVDEAEPSVHNPSVKPKSVSSGISTPASLTRDRLPQSMSKVALSYRTNEWAKHLSYADAPEPEELNIAAPLKSNKTKKKAVVKEEAAPVNVEELQQGADDGVPPAAFVRSDSRVSVGSLGRSMPKRDSRITSTPNLLSQVAAASPEREQAPIQPQPISHNLPRSASQAALRRTSSSNFEPIAEERDAAHNPDSIPEEDDYSRPMSAAASVVGAEQSPRASIPGVVSYNSPQTLLGQRELFLRSRSQGNLVSPISAAPDPYAPSERAPSDAGSIRDYPMYAAAFSADPDDLPLSQRREMIRQSSVMSMNSSAALQQQMHRSPSAMELTDNSGFDSHQPKRNSSFQSGAAREAKLAHFRNSVATDLRAGTPMVNASGRETPFASNSLLGGRDAEIQRNIQMQRNMILGQKEAEAQRAERQRREKEWTDRAFDERMRNGDLLEAHREAMRKMQQGSK